MSTMPATPSVPGSHSVVDRLADLTAIERPMIDAIDGWAASLGGHPETAALLDQLRAISESPPVRLGPPPDASADVVAGTPAALDALRQIAAAAVAAVFAGESAWETARLAGDSDSCDLIEARASAHAAIVLEARRAVPHVVARELRERDVTCACSCPVCSVGLCGCIRAELAADRRAWGDEGLARTEGLILHGPPRSGSPLAEAGLEEGDRVLAIGDDPVGSNSEAWTAITRHDVGSEMRIDVARHDGTRMLVSARRVA